MDGGLEWKCSIKEVVVGAGSGLVGLYLKSALQENYLLSLGMANPERAHQFVTCKALEVKASIQKMTDMINTGS